MFDERSRWTHDDDRIYHGTNNDDSENPNDWFRVVVELTEFGPTEREASYQLRQLRPPNKDMSFGWGYNGGGTSQTAEAVLRDALNLGPSQDLPVELREDFCEDVVAHFAEEFMVRRGAVIRWIRGWAVDRDDVELPPLVTDPPPVERYAYQPRPKAVRAKQDQMRQRLSR